MKKRVYVMAPFRAKTEMERQSNIWRAKIAGVQLAHAGFAPVVPHATVGYYYDELPEEEMMEICLSLLAGCHVALCLATSEGVRLEIAYAEVHAIPVFTDIKALYV